MQTACFLLELGEERRKLSTLHFVEGRPATSRGAWSILRVAGPALPLSSPVGLPCLHPLATLLPSCSFLRVG